MLIVVAFFAVAWFPLQHLTGKSASPEETPLKHQDSAKKSGEGFTVRMISSHPLKSCNLDHLGKRLLTIKDPDSEEIEEPITGMVISGKEVELWIEAELKSPPGSSERAAVHLELIPEDLEKNPTAVTVWGQPGESRVETNAMLLFPASSD
ncbi:MAG: hypothetical protein MK183_04315 [Verrucomicrobiales bacterium]|nr:hypothetical protein [Verrucomicrobiales bacterium]